MYFIFVVANKVFKMKHFVFCYKIDDAINVIYLFFGEIVQFHRVPISIISYNDVKIFSYFLKVL
jgi:hypothetical protein